MKRECSKTYVDKTWLPMASTHYCLEFDNCMFFPLTYIFLLLSELLTQCFITNNPSCLILNFRLCVLCYLDLYEKKNWDFFYWLPQKFCLMDLSFQWMWLGKTTSIAHPVAIQGLCFKYPWFRRKPSFFM